jgi:hypothetical protein
MRRLPKIVGLFGLAAAAAALASCLPGGLDAAGSVKVWTQAPDRTIRDAAASLKGLSVEDSSRDTPWFKDIGLEGGPDLAETELGRDMLGPVGAEALLDISKYRAKMRSTGSLLPCLVGRDSAKLPLNGYFYPSDVSVWGLWYNEDALAKAKVPVPKALGDLDKSFARLANAGIVPLAMGALSGWTALAWVSLLDLRYNGPEAYLALLQGKRGFQDPSLSQAYGMLSKWRNARQIDPAADTLNWPEAFAKVRKGEAAFMLMGAFAVPDLKKDEKVKFIPLPDAKPGIRRAELGVVRGFVVAKASAAPEAALALADAVVLARASDQGTEGARIPSIGLRGKAKAQASPVQEAQSKMLAAAKDVLPQLDRYLSARAANSLGRAMTAFFSPAGGMDAQAIGAALETGRLTP